MYRFIVFMAHNNYNHFVLAERFVCDLKSLVFYKGSEIVAMFNWGVIFGFVLDGTIE
jgi:hypothetical protein